MASSDAKHAGRAVVSSGVHVVGFAIHMQCKPYTHQPRTLTAYALHSPPYAVASLMANTEPIIYSPGIKN